MNTKSEAALLMKRIAETPADRKALAAALTSGDPAELDQVVKALGGGKLRPAKPGASTPQAFFT